MLLTGSVFSKQTTIVPGLLLSGLTIAVPILVETRRTWTWTWGQRLRSATVLATFTGSSALFGIVLQAASHGYAYDLLVHDPLRYARVVPLGQEASTSLRLLIVPLAALVLLALCAAWSLLVNRERRQRRHVIVAVAAVVVAVSPIPTAVLAAAKLGGNDNQLIGPVWTLTLGCAVLLALLRPSVRQLAAAAIACGVLLVGIDPMSQVKVDNNLGVPNLHQHASWVRSTRSSTERLTRARRCTTSSSPRCLCLQGRPDTPQGTGPTSLRPATHRDISFATSWMGGTRWFD